MIWTILYIIACLFVIYEVILEVKLFLNCKRIFDKTDRIRMLMDIIVAIGLFISLLIIIL